MADLTPSEAKQLAKLVEEQSALRLRLSENAKERRKMLNRARVRKHRSTQS